MTTFRTLDVIELNGTKLPMRLKNVLAKFDALATALGKDRAPRSVKMFDRDYRDLHAHVRSKHGAQYGAESARWHGLPFERVKQ